jgi:hypothetical protein
MNEDEGRLPVAAGIFLIVVGIIADVSKVGLDALFGIGFILDPLLITPIAWFLFLITLNHNNIPMFTGKRGWVGWANLVYSFLPGLDFLPDWTVYAVYLTFKYTRQRRWH